MLEHDFFDDIRDNESANTHLYEKISALEKENVDLKDKLLEERFCFILVAVILIDMIVFDNMQTWAAPLCLITLQIFGLIVFGKRCKVDIIKEIIDKVIYGWTNKK